ncbi:TonB-dependent receptor [Methyloligella sp. 2.7D]|uniref:TonB-dependent receptor n=1 Tax=unclassified Methyloligella TaxID=2625955 RepID=UPI00157D84DB|nr:TonB-dependent receptor [Methyloligella sp. GL2]QKP75988.1 TonB-dependent receptor [Methyloligella sp. GL2]
MRTVSIASLAIICAGLGFDYSPAKAQETDPPVSEVPAPLPPPEAVAEDPYDDALVLPEVVVESAPAKRNEKKEVLRASGPAATSADDTGSGDNIAALPGVVVEGEKILRTMRDTTTSVGIITGEDVTERQIFDLKEAISQTANTVVADDNSGFAIRGMSSEGLTGLQHISGVPVIGVVIDGVTQNPDAVRRGARGIWDIDQIEVLRGPQSTLEGRNSLGGEVIVKTNDPTYKTEIIAEGTIGTDELWDGGFVVNTPIAAGQSAIRIAGYKFDHTRDIDYADPDNDVMGEDRYQSIRGKLLLEPDSLPGLSALFTIARTIDEPGTSMVSSVDGDPIATDAEFFKRKFVYSSGFTDFRDATSNNYAADIAYEIRPDMTLRSVTAYADTNTKIKTAADAAFARYGDETDGQDFTQDLRLEMANDGNGLSGVLGLFYGYFERDAYNDHDIYLPFFFPGFPDERTPYAKGTYNAQTDSMAAYADLRYRWNRWQLIGGGRLLRDKVTTDVDSVGLDLATFTYKTTVENSEATFNEFLPKLGLTYDLTSNQTIGVSYNKGYRTGFEQLTPDNRYVTVDPEYLEDYEFSYRSTWMNNTLDLNSNVFYYDYQDQQVAVLNQYYGVAEILNAGSSHAYGAEIEGRWRPIKPLELFASAGFLETKFDKMVTSQGDFSGNEFPEAPPFTFSAGGMYRSEAGWFVGANLRLTDGYYSNGGLSNSPLVAVDGYTVVDVRAGWAWDRFTLTLFAKNLFDEQYLTQVDRNNAPPLASAYAFVGEERLVGLTLNGTF